MLSSAAAFSTLPALPSSANTTSADSCSIQQSAMPHSLFGNLCNDYDEQYLAVMDHKRCNLSKRREQGLKGSLQGMVQQRQASYKEPSSSTLLCRV